VRTAAGLGWPTEESAESSDLGWPSTHRQDDKSINHPDAVSRETGGEGASGVGSGSPEADATTNRSAEGGGGPRSTTEGAGHTGGGGTSTERKPSVADGDEPGTQGRAAAAGDAGTDRAEGHPQRPEGAAEPPVHPTRAASTRWVSRGVVVAEETASGPREGAGAGADQNGEPRSEGQPGRASEGSEDAGHPAGRNGSGMWAGRPQAPDVGTSAAAVTGEPVAPATGPGVGPVVGSVAHAVGNGSSTAVEPEPAVSRETQPEHEEPQDMSEVEGGLPDTSTQTVNAARFGPSLAPAATATTPVEAEAAEAVGYGEHDVSSTAEHQTGAVDTVRRPLPRPAETRVMVIANQKGGVGKTTTAVNMAAGLAQNGMRVLIIDLDPQGNASTALGIDHSTGTSGVYEVLAEGTPMGEVLRECPDVPNLYGVPATIDLAGAEIELVSLVARESRLRKALDAYLPTLSEDDRFDYVFIDCPPSLGLLTINALVAGREMMIPIQCEYYALEGVTQLLRNVDMVRAHLNPDLDVSTIVLTMYDGRTRLSSGVADEVRQYFGASVLHTAIPRSVRISEAPSYGQTVITYDPTSTGALSYLEAARELATHPANPREQTEEQ
jgi:chromosome partitioning protein